MDSGLIPLTRNQRADRSRINAGLNGRVGGTARYAKGTNDGGLRTSGYVSEDAGQQAAIRRQGAGVLQPTTTTRTITPAPAPPPAVGTPEWLAAQKSKHITGGLDPVQARLAAEQDAAAGGSNKSLAAGGSSVLRPTAPRPPKYLAKDPTGLPETYTPPTVAGMTATAPGATTLRPTVPPAPAAPVDSRMTPNVQRRDMVSTAMPVTQASYDAEELKRKQTALRPTR